MNKAKIFLFVLLVAALVTLGFCWLWRTGRPRRTTGDVALRETAPDVRNEEKDERGKGVVPAEPGNSGQKPQERKADGKENEAAFKIRTAQQAIEAAKAILGWKEEGKYSAEKITVKNCFVPFLRKKVNSKVGWKIFLSGITLKLKRPPPEEEYPYPIKLEAENPYVKEFDCVILAETGQLLYIESKIPKGVVIKPDRVPVENAERRYSMGSEKIEALANRESQLSFRDILNQVFHKEGYWVSKAKQIVAFYVIDSRQGIRPAQHLWILYVRGFSPPFRLPGGPEPPLGHEEVDTGAINYMRLLFTGDGKELGGDNMRAPK